MDLYERIVRAKLYIDRNYASSVSLEKLCSESCYSKYHFLRLFKKAYNKTPYQYLSEKRLEEAKQKMLMPALSITDICEKVGFESTTSFTSKFKQFTGETPAVFRLRQMHRQHLMQREPARFIPNCFSSQYSNGE